MFPKPGNAFAQQKALNLQRESQDAASMSSKNSSPSKSANGTGHHSSESVMTTFDMFTSDLPDQLVVTKSRSPTKDVKRKSPKKRAATDPERSYAHKSAVPEPLFHNNPVANLLSKFTTKSKPITIAEDIAAPQVPAKDGDHIDSENNNATSEANSSPTKTESRPDLERMRSSSTSSVNSNPRADPVRTIQDSHDTRFAFGPATQSSEETAVTPLSKYFQRSHDRPERMALGTASRRPTRDGKFVRPENAEIVDIPRIPSVAGSIVSGTSTPSPTLWLGSDGRVYSGPLLQPLAYQQPVLQEINGRTETVFSGFTGEWNSSNGSVYVQNPYGMTATGSWERMHSQHLNNMPGFRTPSIKHDSASSNYSERLSQAGNYNVGDAPVQVEDNNEDNTTTPRNKPRSTSQQTQSSPCRSRGASSSSKAMEEEFKSVNGEQPESEYLISFSEDEDNEDSQMRTPHVVSRGGFVPTPPYPGYQNRLTVEQLINQQFTNLEHKLNKEFRTIHHRIDQSRDFVVDKVLNAISNKITPKQVELLEEQHGIVHSQLDLSEQIKSMTDGSKIDFDKLDKTCLRTEQNIRVDINKTASAIRAVHDTLRSIVSETSISKKTDTAEIPQSQIRRQVSTSALDQSSVTSASPSAYKTKHARKLTPMPGSNTSPLQSPDSMKATLSTTPPHIPTVPITTSTTPQSEIGLAQTTSPSPSPSKFSLAPPRPQFDNFHRAIGPGTYQRLDPIKKPACKVSPGLPAWPPGRMPAINHNTGFGGHRLHPNSYHTSIASNKKSVTFHPEQIAEQKEDEEGVRKNESLQAEGVWTGGKWYERAYGTD